MTMLQVIIEDCETLLERALLNKNVVAFGDDGLGKYGRSSTPKYFTIDRVMVSLDVDLSNTIAYTGEVHLYMNQYEDGDVGMIYTDQNFLISVRNLLREHEIDPKALMYADYDSHGHKFVAMKIDVDLLLNW